MFAKALSNKIFLPPRRQDTKFNYNKHLFLCLGAFVAILSVLSGLAISDFRHFLLSFIQLRIQYVPQPIPQKEYHQYKNNQEYSGEKGNPP